jgi:hypothetical protein
VPESRNRKKADFTPPPTRGENTVKHRPWVAPLMLTCFIVGLVWIVVFYVAGDQIPGMSALNNWNIILGMGLIAAGFVASTQWR